MTINIYTPLEVTDGTYSARITDISEIASRKFKGDSKCLVKLEPYRGNQIYDEILLWINSRCSTSSVEFQFLQTLGVTGEKISVEQLKKDFLNSSVGIEIEDNQAKDGRIFHNIVSFFDADELEDDVEDDDDDFDEDEAEEDSDDDGSESESDSEDEDLEETGSSDEEETSNEMDDFEELPKWNVTKSSSKNSNNKRRNHRR